MNGTTQLASRADQMWPIGGGVVGKALVVRLLLDGMSSMASGDVGCKGVVLPGNGPESAHIEQVVLSSTS